MVDSACAAGPRFRIGGIKLSPELVQFTFVCPTNQPRLTSLILKAIAGRAINLPFLSLSATTEGARISLCVAADSGTIVRHLIAEGLGESPQIDSITAVGTLSLFPHRYSFDLVGRLIAQLSAAGIALYGMCSSISALTVVIGFNHQEEAIRALAPWIDLPANHAPFRQEFDIRQISP